MEDFLSAAAPMDFTEARAWSAPTKWQSEVCPDAVGFQADAPLVKRLVKIRLTECTELDAAGCPSAPG
jgi:hypothetical protein